MNEGTATVLANVLKTYFEKDSIFVESRFNSDINHPSRTVRKSTYFGTKVSHVMIYFHPEGRCPVRMEVGIEAGSLKVSKPLCVQTGFTSMLNKVLTTTPREDLAAMRRAVEAYEFINRSSPEIMKRYQFELDKNNRRLSR